MAEEEDDEQNEEGAAARRRKSGGPGRYFLLVLLILLFEGAVGYWILDQAIPAPEAPPEEEELEPEKETVWAPPIFYEGLSEMVVEPAAFRGNRTVQLSLVLEVDAEVVATELALRRNEIWDLVLLRLETMNEADFRDPYKEKLKADLLRAINAALKNPGVINIYITQLVMQ